MTFLSVLCLLSFLGYPSLSVLQHPISVLFHILPQRPLRAKTVFSQTDRPPSAAPKKPKTEQKNPIIHQNHHVKHIEQAGERKKIPAKQFSVSLWQFWRAGARLDVAAKPAAISSRSTTWMETFSSNQSGIIEKHQRHKKEKKKKNSLHAVSSIRIRHCRVRSRTAGTWTAPASAVFHPLWASRVFGHGVYVMYSFIAYRFFFLHRGKKLVPITS